MTDVYVTLPGELVAPEQLTIPKAVALARALADDSLRYVRLVECRRNSDLTTEFLVLDVEAEVPQRPVNDIRPVERIALRFEADDRLPPEPLALRSTFPQVAHLNFTIQEFPRSLCLYDEPWSDARLTWTVVDQLNRLRRWLALSARGELHEPDQPLEPLLLGWAPPLILPPAAVSGSPEAAPFRVMVVDAGRGRFTYIADPVISASENQIGSDEVLFAATVIWASPRVHGIIRNLPKNLANLASFLAEAGDDLIGILRQRLLSWQKDGTLGQLIDAHLVLILVLPKMRLEGGAAEEVETRAFLSVQNIGEVGQAIGIWHIQDGQPGVLVPLDVTMTGDEVLIEPLNPMLPLTRERAAVINGLDRRVGSRMVAVGVGALGSQVLLNLVREGYGEWTVVDSDIVLPHNLARHAAIGVPGSSKADVMAHMANITIAGESIARPLVADVTNSAHDADLLSVLSAADVILDMSASVAVARHLSRDVVSDARRASLFLNPNGTDAVLLVEDRERTVRLDSLEMQYYRAIVANDELSDHLAAPSGELRYGISCRDHTGRIAQDRVALHAALGSRALMNALGDDGPTILVWRAHENLNVTTQRIATAASSCSALGEWTICVDQFLLENVDRLRGERLPNETGGVLVGTFDTQRHIAYVVDALHSPPDSVEWPRLYIRGRSGLQETVSAIEARSARNLRYIGEWHSHPDGHSCAPSEDDRIVFTWIGEAMQRDGLPPVMLIAGDGQYGWYLDHLP